MYFRLWVHVLCYICREGPNKLYCYVVLHIAVYVYIIPNKDGGRWYLLKNTCPPFKAVELWIELKFNVGELNWIVSWIEMKYRWLNWIVNRVKTQWASWKIEFELNPKTLSESKLSHESKNAESLHLCLTRGLGKGKQYMVLYITSNRALVRLFWNSQAYIENDSTYIIHVSSSLSISRKYILFEIAMLECS